MSIKSGTVVRNPGLTAKEREGMSALDENDREYPVKKWGTDYRYNLEYWEWQRRRDANAQVTEAPSTISLETTTKRNGW